MSFKYMTERDVERFWSKVDKSAGDDACWLWCAGRTVASTKHHHIGGYGQFPVPDGKGGFKIRGAHRVSWCLAYGPIPKGVCVLHRCDNTSCVNPAHLMLGTRLSNMKDKVAKDRQAKGEDLPQSKLTATTVRRMRRDRIELGLSYYELGRKYKVSHMTAYHAVIGRTWKHVR